MASGIASGRLDGLLGYALRRAQLRVFQDFAAALASERITPGQFGALLLIEANPGLTQSALAAALGIDRSTAVALIDRLQRRGLARRGRRDGDRRANALELGPEGRARLPAILRRVAAHERRIAKRLGAGDRGRLLALLERVAC